MTRQATLGPVERARAAWGEDAPASLMDMAAACAESSQAKVADRMDWSATAISQALNRLYPGDYSAIEQSFMGAFREAVVDCPAKGRMPTHECRQWRVKSRKFCSVNSDRVAMFRACNSCARNAKGGDE